MKLVFIKGTQASTFHVLSHLPEPSSKVGITIINFYHEENEAKKGKSLPQGSQLVGKGVEI